jgi:hypothetical protein
MLHSRLCTLNSSPLHCTNRTNLSYNKSSLYRLRKDHTEDTLLMYCRKGMFTMPLSSNRSLLLRGVDHIGIISTVLLTACVLKDVYTAVAW